MLRTAWNLDRLHGSGVATSGEQGNQVPCFKQKKKQEIYLLVLLLLASEGGIYSTWLIN